MSDELSPAYLWSWKMLSSSPHPTSKKRRLFCCCASKISKIRGVTSIIIIITIIIQCHFEMLGGTEARTHTHTLSLACRSRVLRLMWDLLNIRYKNSNNNKIHTFFRIDVSALSICDIDQCLILYIVSFNCVLSRFAAAIRLFNLNRLLLLLLLPMPLVYNVLSGIRVWCIFSSIGMFYLCSHNQASVRIWFEILFGGRVKYGIFFQINSRKKNKRWYFALESVPWNQSRFFFIFHLFFRL